MQSHGLFDPAIRKGKYWSQVEYGYSKTWKGYHMQPHAHDRAEIMYVLKGKCLVHFLAPVQADRRTRKLGVGEFILIDRGVPHALSVPESSYMCNVEFAIRQDDRAAMTMERLCAASSAFGELVNEPAPYLCGEDRGGELYAALQKVVDDLARLGISGDERALRDLHMGELLLVMAQACKAGEGSANVYGYVQKAVRLMSERLEEPIRVAELADEIGITPSYLQRIFKQVTQRTLIDSLNQMRVERAKLLLSRTEEPVVDVAIASGYHSRQHFSRVFTALVGLSPQAYRKQYQHEEAKQVFLFEDATEL